MFDDKTSKIASKVVFFFFETQIIQENEFFELIK